MKLQKHKFVVHKDYRGPKLAWLYDCSWSDNKKIIGIQFVTERYLYSIIFNERERRLLCHCKTKIVNV